MPITTRLQTKFTLQRVFMIVICLVFGLWGVYDYLYKIPATQRAYERGQVCLNVKQALEAEPGSAATRESIQRARRDVEDEVRRLLDIGVGDDDATITAEEAIASIKTRNDEPWFYVLQKFAQALGEAERRRAGGPTSPEFQVAYAVAEKGVTATANVSPPGKFDRATQWAFMLCLPFAPYYAWTFARTRRRVYTLDEDGTLHSPEGTWPAADIADLDMDRWMAKSIAWVVHRDGRRLKLDDYVHRNTHLIVGALASQRYPDQWDAEARARKPGEDQAETDAEPAEADGAAPEVEATERT